MPEIRILEYLDIKSRSPFAAWFEGLPAVASAKVAAALYQLAAGNWSNVKGVGAGVFERKIDAGPGYRVYYALAGRTVVLLLCGGDKRTQRADIARAVRYWAEFQGRRR